MGRSVQPAAYSASAFVPSLICARSSHCSALLFYQTEPELTDLSRTTPGWTGLSLTVPGLSKRCLTEPGLMEPGLTEPGLWGVSKTAPASCCLMSPGWLSPENGLLLSSARSGANCLWIKDESRSAANRWSDLDQSPTSSACRRKSKTEWSARGADCVCVGSFLSSSLQYSSFDPIPRNQAHLEKQVPSRTDGILKSLNL